MPTFIVPPHLFSEASRARKYVQYEMYQHNISYR